MDSYYSGDGPGIFSLFYILIPLMVLDLVLRGFTLWKSARKGQNIWFTALLIFNSMGILPLIYLVLNRDQKKSYSGIDKRKKK